MSDDLIERLENEVSPIGLRDSQEYLIAEAAARIRALAGEKDDG